MRILIAEDDQVLADGLLRSLRGAGAVVDHVASGTEADTALVTNHHFDLLILTWACRACTGWKCSSACAGAAMRCRC